MDDSFGKVTQALKDAGLYDNSIIIFSSDVSLKILKDLHLMYNVWLQMCGYKFVC